MWHCEEKGQGRPLVLLHGIGMSSFAWSPVLDELAKHRRVLAFDTAGFGKTPVLPEGVPPTVPNLVRALLSTFDAMGLHEPVDVVGNSLGGWMALEVARQGRARSVVAISPAGLWKDHPASWVKHFFGVMRVATRLSPGGVKLAMKSGVLRELLLSIPLSFGSRRMPPSDALRSAIDFALAPGFDDTLANAGAFTGGQSIACPLTVAFGTRDWLLTPSARRRDQLPSGARWVQPAKWGHVPMWVDPQGVIRLILDGTV
ncbi:alpha/beta fold hydrolase [Aquabacterium sp.]|uniref:alpha/beta fold hydrolase n=1 Tax=Aquabacterium sp. TaxID=1872578 RepID=UPI003D6D70AA